MKTLTIRGIDAELDQRIRKRSNLSGESINRTVLRLLNSAFGLEKNKVFPIHHDLDDFAGTWTQGDENEFRKNIQELNEIDKELWK